MKTSTGGIIVTPERATKKMGLPNPPQQNAVPCISAASPNHPTAKPVPPCISVASNTAIIEQKSCSFCHQIQITPPMTRCKECNKVYQRVILDKNQLNEGSLEAWDNMSREKKKAAFIKENHELTGENLKAKIQAVCTEELQPKITITPQGNGTLLDSPDLAEKYKNKPDQLTNVRAKANSIIYPNRRCRVYEDLCYASGFKDEATLTTKRKLDLSTEETVRAKARKKAKAKAKAKATAPNLRSEAEHPNVLCPQQVKRLDNLVKFMDAAGERLAALKDGIAVIPVDCT